MDTLIRNLLDEAFIKSELTEPKKSELYELLVSFYEERIKYFDTELEANQYIYGNRLTQKHDVYRYGKTCFVLASSANPGDAARPIVLAVVQEHSSNRNDIPAQLIPIHETVKKVRNVFHKYHLSRRNFTTEAKEVPVYPEEIVLQEFYECGRKAFYLTEEEAAIHTQEGNNPYQCEWCGNWHQGRTPTGVFIPHEMKLTRWKQTWRRYKNV